MKHRIVADGESRLHGSAEFQARLRQLHDSVWERHADEIARAGLFRRLILRWQIWREFRQERRKMVPSAKALYVSGGTRLRDIGR
ncbi:MAG TPA: hypothetical protein VK742_11660 [Candidatus Sulfotelmatobacter sp.]|jgi:hypothetical protein|nr:hypothetical protein [Candidatus Sulfotelmatobacter sp.]